MKERRNEGRKKERKGRERKIMKKREILWTNGVRLNVDRNVGLIIFVSIS